MNAPHWRRDEPFPVTRTENMSTKNNARTLPFTVAAAPSDELARMARQLAEMQAENERLKVAAATRQAGRLSVKVSAKGCASVYGLQRMPLSLYPSQWERLAKFLPEILAFIRENKDREFEVEEYTKDETGKSVKTGRKVKTKLNFREE
jgi:hypothetical protein